jgi:hypothetical protein
VADDDQGYVPLYQKGQPQTAAPAVSSPQAPPPVKDPNDQGYVPLVAPKQAGGGTTGGGTTGAPAAQPAQPGDWSSVAVNEAAMGLLPGLRTQAQAARQRLGPTAAASADVAGNFASPTTALNFVPYVGPELAGGVHEAVKSYMSQPDWVPNSAELTQIGKDAAAGVAGGVIGHGAGAALTNPELFKIGGTALAGKIAHPYASADYQEVLGALGMYKGLGKVADWASEKMATPAAQAAMRSLVQGGTAAARASSPGPLWDQWVPGQ